MSMKPEVSLKLSGEMRKHAEPGCLKKRSSKVKDGLSQKIDKTIEIITVPKLAGTTQNQKNVGIILDEDLIQQILAKSYENVFITEINTHGDLDALVERNPDLVFSGVKYFIFSDTTLWLNDYLDLFGIPYIASNREALECEADKARAKDFIHKAGIATAGYFITSPGKHQTEESIPLSFPLFVKPVNGGDSRGVDSDSVVCDFPSFSAKVAEIQNLQHTCSLVETYLSGKEYSVGVFENIVTGGLMAMPIEIIVKDDQNGNRVLDFDTKRNDTEEVVAVDDQVIHSQLSNMAIAAFRALGGKSFGRIDIMMNHAGVPHFIEANLMPGLRKGYFYRSCRLNLGMNYEQMILRIAKNGLMSGRNFCR